MAFSFLSNSTLNQTYTYDGTASTKSSSNDGASSITTLQIY